MDEVQLRQGLGCKNRSSDNARGKRQKEDLKFRAAFRDKAKNVGPLWAKARVVALGCNDPDLYSLCRESATPTRQAEMLVYAIFISGRNGRMNRDGTKWHLWTGDVRTFLQGVPESREEPLFLSTTTG